MKIVSILFGVLMVLAGLGHFFNPDFYAGLVPDFVSLEFANISSGIIEVVIGIAMIIPQTRKWGWISFMLLMLAFMPLHIWDLTKEQPMVGSKMAAIIRIIIQCGLIFLGFSMWKKARSSNDMQVH